MTTQFKVGDKVRLRQGIEWRHGGEEAIATMKKLCDERRVLEVLEVTKAASFPIVLDVFNGSMGFAPNELELAFEVGDTVRVERLVMPAGASIAAYIGRTGTVESTRSSAMGVRFSENDCRIFHSDELSLVSSEAPSCPQPEPRPDAVRIQELLEANNALVEREREAKRTRDDVIAWNETLADQLQAARLASRAERKLHDETLNALRGTIRDLQSENAAQAALLEKAERGSTDNLPATGSIVWITEGGETMRFCRTENAWTPATLVMRPDVLEGVV